MTGTKESCHEVTSDLAVGVAKMAVDTQPLDGQPSFSQQEKVSGSGIDSFVDSSDDSESMLAKTIQEIKEGRNAKDSMSIHDRTMLTRGEKVRQNLVKRSHMKGPGGAVKDIDKKTKKSLKLGIAHSIKELEKKGLVIDDLMGERTNSSTDKNGESPVKRSRMTLPTEVNLTGAHDEACQEQ
jgi:hypothetical protein